MHKVQVSERALVARINRKLAKKGERMNKTRPGSKAEQDLGGYYVVDEDRNSVTATHCEPEAVAKGLGVLKGYEEVVREDGEGSR